MRESITLTTSDNVRIVGHWYPVAEPKGWALLLHMMPATKESYVALAEELQRRGIASLAIDFRGHGESQGGPNDYERFSDAEQQGKIRDVEAAFAWLRERGMSESKVTLVGASIGANLALQSFEKELGLAGVVLLSPGLNYRGVDADAIARRIASEMTQGRGSQRKIFLAAGGANDEYSTRTIQQLAAILGPQTTLRTFANAGHGTTMFESEPVFLTEVADWIVRQVQ